MFLSSCADRGAAMALISGPSGSGKSLFLRYLVDHARSEGAQVVTTAGRPGDETLGVLGRLTDRIEAGAGARESERSLRAMCSVLSGQADHRPLVIALDDLHLADLVSLTGLCRILTVTTAHPITVVLAGHLRPATMFPVDCHTMRVVLAPFSAAEVEDLAGRVIGPGPASAFAPACHEHTGGVPRLVTAMIADTWRSREPGAVVLGAQYRAAVRDMPDRPDPAVGGAAVALATTCPDDRTELFSGAVAPVPDTGPAGGVGSPTTTHDTAHRRAKRALVTILTDGPNAAAAARLEQLLYQLEPDPTTIETIGTALSGIVYCDRPDRARAWCDKVLSRIGADHGSCRARIAGIRAEAALRQGDLDAAVVDAVAAMQDAGLDAGAARAVEPLASYVLAGTQLGEHAAVAGTLEEAVPAAGLQTRSALLYFHARGYHHWAAGRFPDALEDFLTCGELAMAWNFDQPSFVPWRGGAAQAFLGMGDVGHARWLLEEQLARLPDSAGRSRGITLRLLALTTPADRRRPILVEAVSELEKCPGGVELGWARAELAAIVAGPGPDETVPGPAGVPVEDVFAALSVAEQRVATLAAHRHTNRAISHRLCITVSTVEQHLTRIYRKLDIRRRRELCELVETD